LRLHRLALQLRGDDRFEPELLVELVAWPNEQLRQALLATAPGDRYELQLRLFA
jgi:hypothetical protein